MHSLLTDAYIFAALFGHHLEGSHTNLLVFYISVKQSVVSFNMTVQDSSNVTRNSTNIDMPVTGQYYNVLVKFDTLRLSDGGLYSYLVVATDGNNDTAIIKGTVNFFIGVP